MDFDIDKLINERNGCGSPASAALNSLKEEAEATDLYLNRAEKVQDPQAREVYKDIAKEEAVHMGEAAQLLDKAAPDVAEKVPEGMDEVRKKLDMLKTPPGWSPDIEGTMGEMMTRRR
jgi:rubrerythrin